MYFYYGLDSENLATQSHLKRANHSEVGMNRPFSKLCNTEYISPPKYNSCAKFSVPKIIPAIFNRNRLSSMFVCDEKLCFWFHIVVRSSTYFSRIYPIWQNYLWRTISKCERRSMIIVMPNELELLDITKLVVIQAVCFAWFFLVCDNNFELILNQLNQNNFQKAFRILNVGTHL